jgi:hypothetical protein
VRRYSQEKNHKSRSLIRAPHNVLRRVQSEVLCVGRTAMGPKLVSIDFQGGCSKLGHQFSTACWAPFRNIRELMFLILRHVMGLVRQRDVLVA